MIFIAYDFEAFVGTSGGYIGLFLGYAFLQVPGMLLYMINWCRNFFLKWVNGNAIRGNTDEKTETNETAISVPHFPGESEPSMSTLGTHANKKFVNILRALIRQEMKNELKNNRQATNFKV